MNNELDFLDKLDKTVEVGVSVSEIKSLIKDERDKLFEQEVISVFGGVKYYDVFFLSKYTFVTAIPHTKDEIGFIEKYWCRMDDIISILKAYSKKRSEI